MIGCLSSRCWGQVAVSAIGRACMKVKPEFQGHRAANISAICSSRLMGTIALSAARRCHSTCSQIHNQPHLSRNIHLWTRQCAKKRLAFDIDPKMVKSDTVVYTYTNPRLYRMMTIFGIVQLFFWANLASFSYSAPDLSKMDNKLDEKSFWGTIAKVQSKYKKPMALLCVGLGYLVLTFTWFYPQRSVNMLTLLKGGQTLRVTTYTHFGRTRHFDLPQERTSFMQSREAGGSQLSMKIKDKWFYYLLDKNDGKFHEPNVFDYVVGLKRNLD